LENSKIQIFNLRINQLVGQSVIQSFAGWAKRTGTIFGTPYNFIKS